MVKHDVSVVEQTEEAFVVRTAETNTQCASRYTLTPDGTIRLLCGRRLTSRSSWLRRAIEDLARKNNFKFIGR